MIPETDLEPAGQRRPPRAPGPATSSQVSVDGELLGKNHYMVLDELDWYL
jgi:hypothetical protein